MFTLIHLCASQYVCIYMCVCVCVLSVCIRPSGTFTIHSTAMRRVLLRDDSGESSHVVRIARYMECQKNHAASFGGHAVDGCREFMAVGQEGTPGALTCAACGCHRNFHKKIMEVVAQPST